jgi:beta-glucanase (GH16 family)
MGRNAGRLLLVVILLVAGGVDAVSRAAGAAWPLSLDPAARPALLGPLASSGGLWVPTFDDEFDGDGVDGAKWSNGFGWGDSAANFAAWCDPAANVVAGGVLVQRADRLAAPHEGKAYGGACLHTKEKFSQLYGYWEARIRVASGAGLHSAFWGKPANERWPPELDVEEVGGARPDTVIMTVHWRDAGGHRQHNQRYEGDDLSSGFHVFGAEWSPDGTDWYVDGVERAHITDGAAALAAEGPFYALLDLQVGLQGAVQPSAATPFPAEQRVDYVRVWERPSGLLPALVGPPSGSAAPASAAASAAATAALCSTRATLAATVRPLVAAAIRSRTKGVTAPPLTPAPAASARAASMTGPSSPAGTSQASGTGVTTRTPPP